MYGSFLIDMGLLIGQNIVDIPVKVMMISAGLHYIVCDQILDSKNLIHYLYALGTTYTFMFFLGKYIIYY